MSLPAPPGGPGRPDVTVRYWAAARAAVGSDAEDYPAVPTLADLLALVAARHRAPATAAVLAACSVLVDEQPVGRRPATSVPLGPGAVVDLLPPFAGG